MYLYYRFRAQYLALISAASVRKGDIKVKKSFMNRLPLYLLWFYISINPLLPQQVVGSYIKCNCTMLESTLIVLDCAQCIISLGKPQIKKMLFFQWTSKAFNPPPPWLSGQKNDYEFKKKHFRKSSLFLSGKPLTPPPLSGLSSK